jgi:hypothetical protein
MPLQIASDLAPAGGGTFYLLEDIYLKGGLQIRKTVAERDAIAISNLKLGALVLCLDQNKIWQVTELVVPSRENPDAEEKVTWEELPMGGGTGGIEEAPEDGKTYGRKDGEWVEVSVGSGGGFEPGKRIVAIHTTDPLPIGVSTEFEMQLAVSSLVLKLSVNRPVKVSAYSTPAKDEPNPYQFLATPDHLTDDGSMLLSDGTIFRTRNFSIFANMEATPSDKIYFTVENAEEAEGPVILTITYLPLETLPTNP